MQSYQAKYMHCTCIYSTVCRPLRSLDRQERLTPQYKTAKARLQSAHDLTYMYVQAKSWSAVTEQEWQHF